jgi:adenine-specific DNA-methyltransferase
MRLFVTLPEPESNGVCPLFITPVVVNSSWHNGQREEVQRCNCCMKPIFEFVNRIITGDCLEVMQEMPEASVDLILTDPPYLVNYTSRDGRGVANDNKSEWVMPAFRQMYRVLKPNRFLVCFYGWNKVDRFFGAWWAVGFYPVGHLVWVKKYASNQGFVRYRHESAYLLAKGRPEYPPVVISDVLEWTYTGDTLHPTQKPVLAMVPPILAFSQGGDIVLDPFIGSGTTAIAASILNRRYIGIEIDPAYAKQAEERVQRAGTR